jgi:hypothetical protein
MEVKLARAKIPNAVAAAATMAALIGSTGCSVDMVSIQVTLSESPQ